MARIADAAGKFNWTNKASGRIDFREGSEAVFLDENYK